MLSAQEVKKIVNLARLRLTDKEEEKMKIEVSSILGYIEKLNNVNTENVEPLYQTTGLVNSTREDKHRGDFKTTEDLNAKLIGQAPDKQDRFIRVKSVLTK